MMTFCCYIGIGIFIYICIFIFKEGRRNRGYHFSDKDKFHEIIITLNRYLQCNDFLKRLEFLYVSTYNFLYSCQSNKLLLSSIFKIALLLLLERFINKHTYKRSIYLPIRISI